MFRKYNKDKMLKLDDKVGYIGPVGVIFLKIANGRKIRFKINFKACKKALFPFA